MDASKRNKILIASLIIVPAPLLFLGVLHFRSHPTRGHFEHHFPAPAMPQTPAPPRTPPFFRGTASLSQPARPVAPGIPALIPLAPALPETPGAPSGEERQGVPLRVADTCFSVT
jgi:hypothetical protein